jgi:hypothetical protein
MKKIFLLATLCQAMVCFSQPTIVWEHSYGGSNEESPYNIKSLEDGSLIVSGDTYSNDGDISGYHNGFQYDVGQTGDLNVVRLNASGNITWQRCLGGAGHELPCLMKILDNGNILLMSNTQSNDGDVEDYHVGFYDGGPNPWPTTDIWVLTLDPDGNIIWQNCLGGTNYEYSRSIEKTTDGGFIIGGETRSGDGDVLGYHYGYTEAWGNTKDIWVVKLSAFGTIEWQRSLGGGLDEELGSVKPTADGGFIVVGTTHSSDGDVSGSYNNTSESIEVKDLWVIKLNSAGEIIWQRCFGGTYMDEGMDVIIKEDGDLVVFGLTNSSDGNVVGHHEYITPPSPGDPELFDIWLFQLDTAGNMEWQRCLGGSSYDAPEEIQVTNDGDYIIVGQTVSNNGDVSGNNGSANSPLCEICNEDIWVVKVNLTGNLIWQKCLGSSDRELYGSSLLQTSDNGIAVLSSVRNNNGDVDGLHGWEKDLWLVKLNTNGQIEWQRCLGGTEREGKENKDDIIELENGNLVVAGYTYSNDGDVSEHNGGGDFWIVNINENLSEIADTKNELQRLSPIPTHNNLSLESEVSLIGLNYRIFNICGKEVKVGIINTAKMTIDVEDLSPGVYSLKIEAEKPLSLKFIKN